MLKRTGIWITLALLGGSCSQMDINKTIEEAEKTSQEVMKGEGGETSLTQDEIVKGLKEALEVGTKEAVKLASQAGGFNQNPRIRIPFPPEAQEVKDKAEELGMDKKVAEFENTLNKAAEKAAEEAVPIFVDAIRDMSIQEGRNILEGEENAATQYLKKNTSDQLFKTFQPVVKDAIDQVELTRYWDPLAQAYNKSTMLTGKEEVNPDLDQYVTDRAISGLFTLIADEEKEIRQDPAARVTDLLKKVFGQQ